MRVVPAVLAALFCTAATVPPPSILHPHIREGRFEPDDYRWMRGSFDDATPAEKAAFAEIGTWLNACMAADLAEMRIALRHMGIAVPKLEGGGYGDPLCASVANMPHGVDRRSYAGFSQAVVTARAIAESYLAAVRVAEEAGGARTPELADALRARPQGEQMLRSGLGWGERVLKDAPSLAPEVRPIVLARLGAALAERDRANTRWLKGVVAERGWPKISEVGEPASMQAWLLVQHADVDPAFQLRVLRLMEPLVPTGEVSRRNYAYLYDRVMLKLTGRQRYATQVMCKDGARVPQPLENEAAMPERRVEAGLEPFARYLTQMRESFGGCPPA